MEQLSRLRGTQPAWHEAICALGRVFVCCIAWAAVAGLSLAEDLTVVTRTLFHAPDGSPDSRTSIGVGEWVYLITSPEAVSNVEWILTGDGEVTNRHGNPSILVVGGGKGEDGELTIQAVRQGDSPATREGAKPNPGTDAKASPEAGKSWKIVEVALKDMETLAKKPNEFDAHCKDLSKKVILAKKRSEIRSMPMTFFTKLLADIKAWKDEAPGSFDWARIRSQILESATLRLACCLDETKDKKALDSEFWSLFNACIDDLQTLKQMFDAAGGEANAMARINNANIVIGGIPARPARDRRNEVANALSREMLSVKTLLQVQFLNAAPSIRGEDALKTEFAKHGFTPDDYALIFGDEAER